MKRQFVENGWWKLKYDGTLIISIRGEIDDDFIWDELLKNYREKIKSIIIKKGATCIGHSSFEECINLKSVIVKDGVERIELYAFNNCYSLRMVKLPGSVKVICAGAFEGCWADVYIDNYEENVSIYNMGNAGCDFIFKQKE